MARCIDAAKLLDLIRDHDAPPRYGYLDLWDIEDTPTEDVQPVKHGKWIDNKIQESMLYACSNCGFPSGAYSFNYCPNCGVKMDENEECYVRDIFMTRCD